MESIEILKGSQGVLYGTDAIGGVIKVTTKKSGRARLTGELGSFGNRGTEAVTPMAPQAWGQFSLGVSHREVDGISTFNKFKTGRPPEQAERDGYQQTDLTFNWQQDWRGHQLLASFKNSRSDFEFDNSQGDISGNESVYKNRSASLQYNKSFTFWFYPDLQFSWRQTKGETLVQSTTQ